MAPWIPILAGTLASQLFGGDDEEKAKKQAIANMRMDLARRMAPDMPTYGFQAAQLKQQLADRRDEGQRSLLASLVPMAVGGIDSLSAAPSQPSIGGLSNALGASNDQRFGTTPVPYANGAYQVNHFRGLDDDEFGGLF
jgi:hypothetical protein